MVDPRPDQTALEILDDLDVKKPGTGHKISLKEVKACGMDFMNDAEVAAKLNIDFADFKLLLKGNKVIRNALRQGKAFGRALIKMQSRKLMMHHGSAGTTMTIHLRRVILGETEKREVKTSGTQKVEHLHTIDVSACTDDELAILRTIAARQEASRAATAIGDRSGDKSTAH